MGCTILFCRILFPDFPGQNELFSLTNMFKQNTNVAFQLLARNAKNESSETNLKVEVQIMCERSNEKKI